MVHRSRRFLAPVLAFAIGVGLFTSVSTATVLGGLDRPAGTWLPPAYLMWRTGGLPGGLTPKLARLDGVRRVVVVAGDTLWMTKSVRANGTVVDAPPLPFRVPLEVMAAKVGDMLPFLPGAWRDIVASAWRDGRAVMGESSAALRRLDVGDRVVFKGGDRLTIGAIVPDEVVAWSELMVARDVGRSIGVNTIGSPCSRPTATRARRGSHAGSPRSWAAATHPGCARRATPGSGARATRCGLPC